ncbi:MAG: cation:dicarboxylase symporter family transporter [bacterium]|nr:cation:dicarboxylase symporter family transporter [bacterium]
MSFHWKVLLWMLLGAAVGLFMQWRLDAPAWTGATFASADGGVQVASVAGGSPAAKAKLAGGDVFREVILDRGPDEEVVGLGSVADLEAVLQRSSNGEVLWFVRVGDPPLGAPAGSPQAKPRAVALGMDPSSSRARWIYPFTFVADIFLALLKMLIVPLVLSSIVTGVAGVGTMKDLRRLGGKTFLYYMSTSLLAIVVGQTLVNVIRPGEGASLGLSALQDAGKGTDDSFVEVLKRMVPPNIFESLQDNGAMLSIIFFALLLGFFITQAEEPHSSRIRGVFESFFEVMMKMAEGVLKLLPYGVFALIVKVTASTGFAPFKALLLYMITVATALILHACVTLPLVLKFVGRLSPLRWAKAMSPALMTAFSTSSSSMTLPVTLKTVEQRGRVSNKVTSFTLPLGATINMDGTALYECIGVIFLAQYYATVGGDPLTFSQQAFIVILALLASVGAAGIPSAGLVMMLTILSALKLPVEGAALLLAVDRPLDMMRTVVNVWSDSCGAAVIARSEGEEGPLEPVLAT